ncbi:MAG: hypothetical protein PW790_01875 [Parvibaculaceae bacterium]|nr:hypothetical protein [Parvibaculaceae bacterium]
MRRVKILAASALLLVLAACATPAKNNIPGSSTPENETPRKPAFSGSADTLLGMSPDRVSALLGAPKIKRTEKEAQIWQYRSDACSLLLFFYPNTEGQIAAYYVDARRPEGGAADKAACLSSIAQAGHGS